MMSALLSSKKGAFAPSVVKRLPWKLDSCIPCRGTQDWRIPAQLLVWYQTKELQRTHAMRCR